MAIPACFAAGAFASHLALALAAPHFSVDLAQPLPVATNWGAAGLAAWGIVAVTILCAGVAYVRGLRAPRAGAALAAAAAAMAAGLFWSPLLSSDVYAYAAYGEMARLGLNPYVHHALPRDAVVAAAAWQWSGTLPICVYGEGFAGVARALVAIAHGFGTAALLQWFRVLACLSLLACGVLARFVTGDRARGERAAAFIAANPIALYAAIEGHNDALALAVVLAGFAILRTRPALGSAAVALAASIKAPALAAAGGLALQRIAQRRNAAAVAAGTAIGAAIALGASVPLLRGVATSLAPHGVYAPAASVQALGPFVAVAIAMLLLARLPALTHAIDRWTLLALIAWLAIPNPYPWYAVWLIGLAAFARDRRVAATVLTVSTASLLRYVPDAAGALSPPIAFVLALASLLAYLPMLAPERGQQLTFDEPRNLVA